MRPFFGFVTILSWSTFGALLISLLVFGSGYLLTLILPLNQLQASTLFLASLALLVLTFIFMSLVHGTNAPSLYENLDELLPDKWDDDWERENWADKNQERFVAKNMTVSQEKNNQSKRSGQSERVGRNQPCPCGSGKKFKFCCSQKAKVLSLRT